MRVPKPAAALLKVQALGPAPAYAAVVLLATAFFFCLHYLGGRIPYEVAQQRFRTEFEAGRPDEGQARGYKKDHEYCEMSEAVMAGAKRAGEGSAFRDAVILKAFEGQRDWYGSSCRLLNIALNVRPRLLGAEIGEGTLKTHYWWGSKALYAIALRFFSVHEIRELTLISTRAAYLLLAVSLALSAPKTLAAASPLIVFGAFFSGVEYWADVANGVPYLWTVLSAAVLVWLLRGRPAPRMFSGAVPFHCFTAGTVSSYLWLGDGHTFLAVTWIGLLVWFDGGAARAAEKTRRAVSCIALYVVGFLACYGLGLTVRAAVVGHERFWPAFQGAVDNSFQVFAAGVSTGLAAHLGAYAESFYAMAWPDWAPAGVVPAAVAASALAVSAGFAVFQARRGRSEPLCGVLWIAGLVSVNFVSLVMPEDIHYRTARFVFVPLALCLSCLVVSGRAMDWKLSSAMLGTVAVVSAAVSWHLVTFDSRAIGKLIASVEDARPMISGGFDVHLAGDRLVYVKEECGDEDVDAGFFLHLYPVDEAVLPDPRKPHGFDNLDFAFETHGHRVDGRCAAVRVLPGYGIASIHTGQYVPGQDPEWAERVSLRDRPR